MIRLVAGNNFLTLNQKMTPVIYNLQSQKYRRPFSLCHVAPVNRLNKGKGWDEDKVPGPGPSLSLSQVY